MVRERWKPVVGFEGLYEVSDQGRVRSLDRKIPTCTGAVKNLKGKILALGCHTGGYRVVGLGRYAQAYVHELVLTAFIGPRPSATHQCCHGDNNKANNHLSNLRWDTPIANNTDKIKHGTLPLGVQHHRAMFSNKDIRYIRAMRGHITQEQLASQFGCSFQHISAIQLRKRWNHVR